MLTHICIRISKGRVLERFLNELELHLIINYSIPILHNLCNKEFEESLRIRKRLAYSMNTKGVSYHAIILTANSIAK